jgi:hypothetical protein
MMGLMWDAGHWIASLGQTFYLLIARNTFGGCTAQNSNAGRAIVPNL